MKFPIILFCLLGTGLALQYPVEYQYQYEGRIASGIPALRAQVSALGIKTLLSLQCQSQSQCIAKFTDIQVGEYNEDLQCVQLRQPIPFEWKEMPDPFKNKLEKSFEVNFKADSGTVMHIPNDDVEFITNIRKSVVEILRVEPVIANLGGIRRDALTKYISEGNGSDSFTVEEESIFGRCESKYAITRLPYDDASKEKKEIQTYLKEDEQSEGSPRTSQNVPKLEESYWRLVRAIDFDKCHENVHLQQTGIANMSEASHSQFRSVQSRSSVGSYILKGKPGSFRVERAIVEGALVANPYGFKTERLQTITNQTLTLVKAHSLGNKMSIPNPIRQVSTWQFEVASPFSPPNTYSKPWVNYYRKNDKYSPVLLQTSSTGIRLSPSQYETIKNNFLTILESTERELYSDPSSPEPNPSMKMTSSSRAISNLQLLTDFMKSLPIRNVRDLFTKVFSGSDPQSHHMQMMLADVAAASGASAPIKVLLEYMSSGKISKERSLSIFATLPNNLYAPSVMQDLMEFVKSVDVEKDPLFASSALVNFASLANRVCLSPQKFNYSVPNPLFGREMCQPKQIVEGFVSYLKSKLDSAPKSWVRAIYIQATSSLGSHIAFPILKPYIYGHRDSNPRVRIVAIYGLTRQRMPNFMRGMVFDTLMEIVENVKEVTEIRQSAVAALLSWGPDAAWWQRMAKMSWSEPSQSMAAFMAFTVESVSRSTDPQFYHQSRIASHAKELMKSFSPSLQYSYSHIFSRYDPNDKIGMMIEFAYLQSLRDAVPSEIYSSVTEDYGDLYFQLYEVAVSSEGLTRKMSEFLSLINSPTSNQPTKLNSNFPGHTESKYIQELSKKFMNLRGEEPERDPEANIYVRAFENMYQYIPLNSEVITKIAGKGGSDFINKLLNGYNINLTKFFNPVDIHYCFPTEIGLPVIGVVSMPSMNLGDAEVKLEIGNAKPTIHDLLKAEHISLLFKSNYKYMSKLSVKMQVPAPWSSKQMEAGLERHREVNLPVYGNVTFHHNPDVKNLTFNLSPYVNQKFPIMHSHNLPYTRVSPMIPATPFEGDCKVIGVEKSREPAQKIKKTLGSVYTGIPFEVQYFADAPYPTTLANYMDYMLHPEEMGKLLSSPTAKQWQYSINVSPSGRPNNISLSLSYFTLMLRKQGRPHETIPDFSPHDTPSERLAKMSSMSQGYEVYGLNAQLFFNVSEPRRYEVLGGYSKIPSRRNKKYNIVVAALSDSIPNYSDSPKALCSQTIFDTPSIHDMDSLIKAIKNGPKESANTRLYYGNSCSSTTIASSTAKLEVSSERNSILNEEVNEICNADPLNPVVQFQTPAIYDMGHLEIQFRKEQIPKSLLNFTYSAEKMMEDALFPHGSYDRMYKGEEGKVLVTAQRPVSNEGYTFWKESPEKRSIFSDIRVPYWTTRIVPWTGLKTTITKSSHLLVASEGSSCQITKSELTTFDGDSFSFNPLHCWTTVVTNFSSSIEAWINVRETTANAMELTLFLTKEIDLIVVTYADVYINGTLVPHIDTEYDLNGHDGKVVLKVINKNSYYEVLLPNKLTAIVKKDKIVINPTSSLKNSIKGLCGNFDGKKSNDKVGPKNCVYTDMELLKYSWTSPLGYGCDHETYKKMEQRVQEYQKTCPKQPPSRMSTNELNSIYEMKYGGCYQFVFPIGRNNKQDLCLSKTPVKMCKSKCVLHKQKDITIIAKCWPEDAAPPAVRNAEKDGYLRYPILESGRYEIPMKTKEATDCSKS